MKNIITVILQPVCCVWLVSGQVNVKKIEILSLQNKDRDKSMLWVHESAQQHFNTHPNEEFMKYFGDVFKVVYASDYRHKASTYSYYILKPHNKPSERYGIGEIIAIYAPYPEIQARDRYPIK